jgi:hypothetical protein
MCPTTDRNRYKDVPVDNQQRLKFNEDNIAEFRASHGRIASFGDAPLLLFTTTGAKSGQRRTSPMMYLADAAAVADHDVVVNATPGSASLELVGLIGPAAFESKVVIDVANANTPSFELVYPNASLGEN